MHSQDNYMAVQDGDIINNKKRGDILSYSISQVAALLGEEDSNIRYYTNIFDNILKIEISDKELRYTNKDIDKLEFLINLKNKGMTIKEVQNYCEELPLDIEDLIEVKENNSISAKEIISTIVELEDKQIDNLKEHLNNKIDESNEFCIQKLLEVIEKKQNSHLDSFKDQIVNEIKEYIDCKLDMESKITKEYIDYKLDMQSKVTKDLCNEISVKIDNLISENPSSEDTVKLQLDKFNEMSISRDNNLINEIKRFENVIERAYYLQQEIDTQKEKVSFIAKLFGAR